MKDTLPYYTPFDIDEINAAKKIEDLLPVALRVLQKMPHPVALVSGPISTGGKGSVEENLKIFNEAIIFLEQSGETVFSQLPFESKLAGFAQDWKQEYCTPILDDFYLPILKSGLINIVWFIQGWESSTGARWEYDMCKKLGIPCLFLKPN